MYTRGKKVTITNVLGRYFRLLLIFAGIALMIAACSKEEEVPKKDPPLKENPPAEGNQGGGQDTIVTPADSLDADLILEHLSLMNGTKVAGEMPSVPDSPIPTDAKDTIYLTKGLRVGYPITIRHDGLDDITGVFVGFPNGSFYYDIPVVADEARDSTDVFYVNIDDLPIANFQDYPITFPIHLMPHVNGMPIKDHIGIVDIEKPNDDELNGFSDCSVTIPAGSDPVPFKWVWRYTFVFNESSELIRKEKTFNTALGGYVTGGCCSGTESYPVGSRDCSHYLVDPLTNLVDTTQVNPKWRPLHIDQAYIFWEEVSFFDDGTFEQFGASYQTNVSLLNSDFCNDKVFYKEERHAFENSGTHDFTPGADYLNITYNASIVPKKTLRSGEIIYSCNTLNLTYTTRGDGEDLTYVMFFLKERYDPVAAADIYNYDDPYDPPWEIITSEPWSRR